MLDPKTGLTQQASITSLYPAAKGQGVLPDIKYINYTFVKHTVEGFMCS